MTNKNSPEAIAPLEGSQLIIAGLLLAVANFIVVLDMTIANVSVPHIAGGLAVSPSEGTYVITSYAVAEAISVPLTGWVAARFGSVRVFCTTMVLFGIFSVLCGLSTSIGFLVASRIFQGLVGGPLMPLSQTLLMSSFPPERRGAALVLWSMTTLIAPILGPIVGGYICDNWGWEFIFYINIPIALTCGFAAYKLLKRFETKIIKNKIDYVGFALLVGWVAPLQYVFDEGKTLDWFSSPLVITLSVISAITFCSFLIWELTEKNPIVDLRIFRHRGFWVGTLTISLAFGAFFGTVVLVPLWLQSYMGYSATWSGIIGASTGALAIFAAPSAAMMSQKFDQRKLVFFGVAWLGIWTLVRAFGATNMTSWQISWPMLIQGIGMPFFFIPLTNLALASVNEEETASAAGLMSFLRTLSGAFATSVVTTIWENKAVEFRNDLTASSMSPTEFGQLIGNQSEVTTYNLDQMIQSQAIMLSTNHVLMIASLTFIFAASAIWLAPKPSRIVEMGSGGH
jgi:DHA2 family multidrug resistance protein